MDVSIVFIIVVLYCAVCFGIYVKMDTIPLLAPFKKIAFLIPVLSFAIYLDLLTKKDVGKWRLTVRFLRIREFTMCALFALSHSFSKLDNKSVKTRHNVYRSTAKYNVSLKPVNVVKRAGAPKGKALYQIFRNAGEEMEKQFA